MKEESIFKHKDIIQRVLYIGLAVIALVREIRSAIGARMGINKVQVKHSQGKIYMNREHMVAGSEGNKRQDFTINNVQGQELINTKFKHRTWFQESRKSCGGGRKGYWNLEWVGNVSVVVCGC